MLEPQDVRYGNIVVVVSHDYKQIGNNPSEIANTYRKTREVFAITRKGISWKIGEDSKSVYTQGSSFSMLEGLKLTRDIFREYGFSIMPIKGALILGFNHPKLRDPIAITTEGYQIFGRYRPIVFVHELQNLFRDITGEDLTKISENE